MMRSSGYNRFGVLMGTSWPASCPRSHRLQGDFSPMITLILLQRAFCATALNPTATLLEHALLTQRFMGVSKAAFPHSLRQQNRDFTWANLANAVWLKYSAVPTQ